MTIPSPLEMADPVAVGVDPDRLAVVAARMDEHVATGGTPAAVLVVARHGKPIFAHAAGEARPGGSPLNVEHVFPIGSQGKPMTAAVILALAERGLIGINEPAAHFLPELAGAHGGVLVAHLLTHTSGWHNDDHETARAAKLDEAIVSVPKGLDLLAHIMLWPGWGVARRFEPGERMQYCDWNYDLLGEIVRRATGDSLDAALRRLIFDPCGMESTAMIVGDDLLPRVIERPSGMPLGPDHADSPISFNDPLWQRSDSGSSGVHSTAVDLVRFGQMILDGGNVGDQRVLSNAGVKTMTMNRIPGVAADLLGHTLPEGCWSFGFGVTGHNALLKFGGGITNPATLRHGGAGGTYSWIDPSTGVVAAYIELVTAIDQDGLHTSWIANKVEAAVSAAVVN